MPKSWRTAHSAPIPSLGDPDVRDAAGNRYRGFAIRLRAFDAFRLSTGRTTVPENLTDDELIWIISALGREGQRRADAGRASVRLAALASRIDGN